MKQYIDKYILLFTNPSLFFKNVAKEKEYWPIILYFSAFFFLSTVMTSLLSLLIFVSPLIDANFFFLSQTILKIILMPFFLILFIFVLAGIVHLGVLFFHGKQTYFSTWKVCAYAQLISIPYGILTMLVMVVLGLLNPAQNIFVPEKHLVFGIHFFATLFVMTVIGVFSLIHSIYASIQGLSQYHQLSTGRAFLCFLVPVIVFIFFIVLFIGLMFLTFLATGGLSTY